MVFLVQVDGEVEKVKIFAILLILQVFNNVQKLLTAILKWFESNLVAECKTA